MHIDFSTLSASRAYHLMTQTVVPRPIAWVLTENASGNGRERYNLAPFSYFNAVASDPPTLMISIGKKPGGEQKDTLRNILRSKKLVIHVAGADKLVALNQSAATLPYGESELALSALDTEPLEHFPLPRLSGCKIAFACSLDHTHEIGEAPQTLVFARIHSACIEDEILHTDRETGRYSIDTAALNPVARLGGNHYALLGDAITLKRPS